MLASRHLLWLAVAAAAVGPTKPRRQACRSGLKGDFGYRTCGSFCKPDIDMHCKYCKCMTCTFCNETHIKHKHVHKKARRKVKTARIAVPASESTPAIVPGFPVVEALEKTVLEKKTMEASKPLPTTPAEPSESAHWPWLIGCVLLLLLLCVAFYAVHSSEVSEAESGESLDLWRTRALCVGFLCLQYATYALLRRYATGILREDWGFASVLGVGEMIKFGIALVAISKLDGASEAPEGPLPGRLKYLIETSRKMAVPAFIYLTMNFLGFYSLRRVDAGTFAVVQQSKVFFTALFARVMLGRTLSVPKWCALVMLVLAVTTISLYAHPDRGCGTTTLASTASAAASAAAQAGVSYVAGVAAVTLDSALSGFATVYFEKVLKTTVLTVWDRNLQLAFWSMLIYLPWTVYENPTNPFRGWSMITLLVAAIGAVGGILVAFVIKYADGLAKNLATASSVVITTAASHVLFNAPMNAAIVLGSLIVIVAGFTYQKVP